MPAWLYPILSALISMASAWGMWHLTQKRSDAKAEAGDEKTWRQARHDAESALGKRLDGEAKERAMQQLKFEQDLAAVTGILKEFAEAQRLLTGLASETRGLSGRVDRVDTRLDQYNESLEAIREHIMQLAINQSKP